MSIAELKEKAIEEIENCLQRLGDEQNSVFPNFGLNSHELEYGSKRTKDEILIETQARIGSGERVLMRINICSTIGV